MRSLLIALLSSSLIGFSLAHLSPYTLHEKRRHVPAGWARSHRFSENGVLPLRLGLTQSNINNIEEYILDVSSPDSPNYGKHWSPAEVAQTFAPSRDTIDTVRNWLVDSGIERERIRLSPSRGWIEVNVTVVEAERLLLTEYNVYNHDSGAKHVACDSYHLPAHVSPHIDLVMPTIHFNTVVKKRGAEPDIKRIGQPGFGIHPKTNGVEQTPLADLSQCDVQITPICLRALYNIVYKPVATALNSFGIVEYTPQAYLQSDLNLFFNTYSSTQVGTSPVLASIDGGVVQTTQTGFGYNGESNLDLQYGMALVGKTQPVTLYQVGDLEMGASFNNFLDALDASYCTFDGGDNLQVDGQYPDPIQGGYQSKDCGTFTPAKVISTSYGYNEADLTPAYTSRQCTEYAKLGMMGVTFVYSSGDNGVAGNGGLCLNPDGSQSTSGTIFNPSFPSGCPYVTSVGATQIDPGKTVTDPEGACEQVIYSGGGFSNQFKIPMYQKAAIGKYLTLYRPTYPKGIWNSTAGSRAFPDLAANGANYVTAVDGSFFLVYGTSASAPVVASMLTMVNDARLHAGKSAIGFINPALYSTAFANSFNDITHGGNPGCGTAGYTAVPGWDPVTGLGTPNLLKLMANFMALP